MIKMFFLTSIDRQFNKIKKKTYWKSIQLFDFKTGKTYPQFKACLFQQTTLIEMNLIFQ